VELKLEGSGPWSIYEDVELIHTPGHSEVSLSNCKNIHKNKCSIFVKKNSIMILG